MQAWYNTARTYLSGIARPYLSRGSLAICLTLLLTLGGITRAQAQDGSAFQDKAEKDAIVVTIVEVENETFPQVTAFITVFCENGLSLDELTADNFALLEDGVEVPPTSITVERDTSRGFNMVLALDISTLAPEKLTQTLEAVKSFIDTLETRDQVALVVFYDEVEVVQDLTGDQQVLNATINALGPQGNYTALNQAVLESATLAAEFPPGHRAVVIVTDSKNNIGSLSTSDAVNQVRELGVPIYTVGFGSRIRPQNLQAIADLTNGQSFILDSPDQVHDSLVEIAQLLRQGYKVTFQSGLQADNTQHDFSLVVTDEEYREGQVQGHFVALPGEVIVNLPGIVDGQTVGDVVTFTAQVTAPAPVPSVEYLLNDRSLAVVDTPPYSFEWDGTSIEPGPYTLTVKAVDGVGNEGQILVHLNLVPPLTVTLSASQQEVELGDEVTLEARVEALAKLAQVEFLLDGDSLGSDNTSPYSLSFDSSTHPVGTYTVIARAEDSLGHKQEASLDLKFVAPPKPLSWRERITSRVKSKDLMLGVDILILIAAGLALIRLAGLQARRFRLNYRLQVENLGNVRSRYALRVDDPSDALEFDFFLKGTKLGGFGRTAPLRERPQAQVVAAPVQGVAAPPADPASTRPSVGQAVSRAKGAGGALAGILTTASSLLPSSISKSARQAGTELREAQFKAGKAEQLSGQMAKAQEAFPSAAQAAQAQAGALPAAVPAAQAPAVALPPAAQVAPAQATAFPFAPQEIVPAWIYTPFVEPGASLDIDLQINPLEPYQNRYYPFKLVSISTEQRNAPLLVEETSIQVVRPSWLRRYYPFLIVLGIMVVNVILLVAFLTSQVSL